MSEPDDHQLLAEFAGGQSETAFSTLVSRYVNLVYSTALRFTGNAHHAEEITQAVSSSWRTRRPVSLRASYCPAGFTRLRG